MRLLLVEDEERLADSLRRGLARAGFSVDVAYDGEQGLALARAHAYDQIVLDVNLPKMDGITVARTLRDEASDVPILMLTARRAVEQRVEGLDAGADDYLTKPFALEELLARLRALTRRGAVVRPDVLRYADLVLDPATLEVSRGGQTMTLRRKEFMVLELLLRHPGQIISKERILDHAWDRASEPATNVVEAQVKALRKAVDPEGLPPLIHTIRGMGYKLDTEA